MIFKIQKTNKMTIKLNFASVIIAAFVLYSCGNGASEVEKKKEKLKELKTEMSALKAEISSIEKELILQDSSYSKEKDKSILVSLEDLNEVKFAHKIEVRGAVASNRNVLISAVTMAKIISINVKEGQNIKTGQILVELDANVLRNNIKELQTSLELAKTLYQKQKNLWDQNIGTEIQYLQAKNQKESLERKLKTAYSQLDNYIIRAPFDGQVNELDVKKGEMMSPGMPICRIVSLQDMHVQSEVSERYVGKFEVGDSINLEIPALNIKAASVITSIGKVVNVQNRTFRIEVSLPKKYTKNARPNQVAVLTITDYVNKTAITVPSKVIQKDAEGNYVYVKMNSDLGAVARKKHVVIGKSYENDTEIREGLSSKDVIITEGYRDVADGSLIKTKS